MLRVTTIPNARAAERYYSASGQDYYVPDREMPYLWYGEAAAKLGLSGEVAWKDFKALCNNLHPQTGKPLTAARREDRDVGRDFTFSGSKSVTLAYTLGGDERVLTAMIDSANDAMRLAEQDVITRVRKKGANAERPTRNGVYTLIPHLTSREVRGEVDPHLHLHGVFFSNTYDAVEGEWKSINFREMKRNAPLYQAVFRAGLAQRLQGLGYELECKKGDFEIVGVPKRALQEFSQRTAVIEKEAKKRGITDPAIKAELGKKTRNAKQPGMPWDELLERWRARMSGEEKESIEKTTAQARQRDIVPAIDNRKAVDYALAHLLERESVVPEKKLVIEALKYGVGSTTYEGVMQDLRRSDLIHAVVDGERMITSHAVLSEETRLVNAAIDGRGQCRAYLPEPERQNAPKLGLSDLNPGQQAAIRHVWESPDKILMIRGAAGTGKTTLTRTALAGIDVPWVILAPTAEASRGVLRREGFAKADTLQRFFVDKKMQESVRGGLIWLDEASLAGSRDLVKLVTIAESLDARIVLSGDPKQMRAVARGDVLTLLADHARLPVAEVTDIRRQQGSYRDIVKQMSEGRTRTAMSGLDALGWVKEMQSGDYRQLAKDYLSATKKKWNAKKKCFETPGAVIVAPTHREAEAITAELRSQLKSAGRLGAADHEYLRLTPLQMTEAEKTDARNLEPGMVLQFNRNIGPFRIGQRVEVSAEVAAAAAQHADAFAAYRQQTLPLAAGDTIRITANGQSKDGHRLNNGASYEVAAITRNGDVRLRNGWLLDKDWGHWAHGLVVTPHAAQGRTVDRTFVALSSQALAAVNKEAVYVGTSRGRKQATLYLDGKAEILQALDRETKGMLATELHERARLPLRTKRDNHLLKLRQLGDRVRIREQQQPVKLQEVRRNYER